MIELHTFGNLSLLRADADTPRSLSLAPKPLALLTYLAVASVHGQHRRDLLLSLLWPDLDEQRARNALSQAISRIRTALGSSVVKSQGTEEIRVDTDALWCDGRAFDTCCRTGGWREALDLYQGDFLAGLHVPAASGFELWQDVERARFRRMAYQAAWKLTEQEREAGNAVEAALWLRRALEIVPTDEQALRELLLLLDELGEPTGALAAYEEQRQRLRREFELEPDPETQALVEQIRARASRRAGTAARRTGRDTADASYESRGLTSLAVLPFHNLTGNPEEDYFADGMTDALINALGQLRSVRVISRQSSIAYRGTKQSLSRIAAELQVDGVVEGSVLRAGNRVRITAQLIRANPEAHLWADSYDRTLEDVLGIHREVAERISAHVRDGLSAGEPQPSPRPRVDPSAFEAFLRGRHYSGMWPEMGRGVECFERSIALDPSFAPASAALAICYFKMATFGLLSPAAILPRLEAAARQALALDESLSDAHVALAMSLAISRRGWPGDSEREVRRAIELDPSNAYARAYLGGLGVALGREDDIEECEQGLRLDPLNPWMLQTLAWARYRSRLYELAERTYDSMLEMHPHLPLPHPFLAQVYLQQGRGAEAVAACRRSRALLPEDSLVLGYGAAILALAGEPGEAESWLNALIALTDRRYVDPYYLAAGAAGLGQTDRAFAWLERVCSDASTSFFLLKTDPLFDGLRHDPRFPRVLESLGFPADAPDRERWQS